MGRWPKSSNRSERLAAHARSTWRGLGRVYIPEVAYGIHRCDLGRHHRRHPRHRRYHPRQPQDLPAQRGAHLQRPHAPAGGRLVGGLPHHPGWARLPDPAPRKGGPAAPQHDPHRPDGGERLLEGRHPAHRARHRQREGGVERGRAGERRRAPVGQEPQRDPGARQGDARRQPARRPRLPHARGGQRGPAEICQGAARRGRQRPRRARPPARHAQDPERRGRPRLPRRHRPPADGAHHLGRRDRRGEKGRIGAAGAGDGQEEHHRGRERGTDPGGAARGRFGGRRGQSVGGAALGRGAGRAGAGRGGDPAGREAAARRGGRARRGRPAGQGGDRHR